MTLDPLYSVEREYAHPVEGMWHAWTDPAALEQWYRPLDLAVVPGSVTSEIEVGGWWTVAVDVPEHGCIGGGRNSGREGRLSRLCGESQRSI